MIAPMQMHSGRVVDLAAPRPGDVAAADIAYHTARIFRWTGGSEFSVAQHNVVVWQLSGEPWGLLHDAAEAYVGDVSHNLKRLLGVAYRRIERPWTRAVSEHFGVPVEDIGYWDQYAAQLEACALWSNPPAVFGDQLLTRVQFDGITLEPWSSARSEKEWLRALRSISVACR